jgi:hypothetical protein
VLAEPGRDDVPQVLQVVTTRLIRVLTKTPFGAEELEDGTTAGYDRPNNILTPGWGAKVTQSAW